MGGAGGSSGGGADEVVGELIDKATAPPSAQPLLVQAFAEAEATASAAAAPPAELVDRVAFPETNAQIAADRAADADVARQAASSELFMKYAQLDQATGLKAMDTREAYEVVNDQVVRTVRAAGAWKNRRFLRLMAVVALGIVALGVLTGKFILPPGGNSQSAGQPPAAQAAGAAPGNAPAGGAALASAVAPVSSVPPAAGKVASGGGPATLQGQFDLASMATQATSLDMLDKYVTENNVLLTYEKGATPASAAKVSGTFALTITLDDKFLYSIDAAVGQHAFGVSPPPMPSTWVGCTVTTDVRGDLTGGQAKAGGAAFTGTTLVVITATVQGCERTRANIQATPRQSLAHVPWTASGGETGLKGKISFPATAEISPGTAWAFEVRTP